MISMGFAQVKAQLHTWTVSGPAPSLNPSLPAKALKRARRVLSPLQRASRDSRPGTNGGFGEGEKNAKASRLSEVQDGV